MHFSLVLLFALAPHVSALLEQGRVPQHRETPFFQTLVALAKEQAWPSNWDRFESGPSANGEVVASFDVGSAVASGDLVVLMFVGGWSLRPTEAGAGLLLLDSQGRLLDKIALGWRGSGPFIEAHAHLDKSPPEFALSFDERGGYARHTIVHDGKAYSYWAEGPTHDAIRYSAPAMVSGRRSTDVETEVAMHYSSRSKLDPLLGKDGLCTAVIADRHFQIIAPRLGDDDARQPPKPGLEPLAPLADKFARSLVAPSVKASLSEINAWLEVRFALAADGSYDQEPAVVSSNHVDNETIQEWLKDLRRLAALGPLPGAAGRPVDFNIRIKRERDRNGLSEVDAVRRFDWSAYLRGLEQRVLAVWKPPKLPHKETGSVEFWLYPDGSMTGLNLWNDNEWTNARGPAPAAALQAIQSAVFAPLPEGVTWPVKAVVDFSDKRSEGGALEAKAGCTP